MPHRVLIAEDDLHMLDALAEIVANTGRKVVKARDGAELVETLGDSAVKFDLVITDVSMPWMTGLQAASSVRYAGLDTPVLVITALRDPILEEQVRALGDKARLLRKPIDFEKLEQLVEELDPLGRGRAG